MEEVRINVFREIPLDKNLNPISEKKAHNSLYLSCDEVEVFICTIDNPSELRELITPKRISDMIKAELSSYERVCFKKALKKTGGKYVFNGEEFNVNGLIDLY